MSWCFRCDRILRADNPEKHWAAYRPYPIRKDETWRSGRPDRNDFLNQKAAPTSGVNERFVQHRTKRLRNVLFEFALSGFPDRLYLNIAPRSRGGGVGHT